MKHLCTDPVFLLIPSIPPAVPVFGIPQDRMSDGSKMGPDLVRLPSDQMNFQKCHLIVPRCRDIIGFDCSFSSASHRNLVCPLILGQKATDAPAFPDTSFHNAQIPLLHRPFLEHLA